MRKAINTPTSTRNKMKHDYHKQTLVPEHLFVESRPQEAKFEGSNLDSLVLFEKENLLFGDL